MKALPKRKGNFGSCLRATPAGTVSMKAPPTKRKGKEIILSQPSRAFCTKALMKVPPTRKGNSSSPHRVGCLSTRLNESPFKKGREILVAPQVGALARTPQ